MYPNLYFFLKEVFDVQPWAFTKYINSFGLLVAVAFVVSAFVLRSELKRKEKLGLLSYSEEKIMVGKPASTIDLIFHFIFGFFVGYKIIGVFFNGDQIVPQEYIFSSQGSVLGGILLGVFFTATKYFEKKKLVLAKPELKTFKVWPHERVGDIVVIAAIAGFLGAKIFDNLENWDRFIQDPIGNLLAPSGLTFYGGLILATASILYFARKKKISIRHLVDSAAPALMIGYAIGRMGCHVSGDGDWGVFNSAYKVDENNMIVASSDSMFRSNLVNNPDYTDYLIREFGSIGKIPHIAFEGSSVLPNWFWAYNYPHNVNEIGVQIPGCIGGYCHQLNPPVFPTTLYEIIACSLLFLILWSLRKKITTPGRIFGLYLFLNGMERFLIEKIRVNSTYNILGFHPTQAELISSLLMITGIAVWIKFAPKKIIA
jgi:prolipoprotein diacylglyceryltransferase